MLIQSKIDNPYSICNGEIISVSNLLTQLNKALENLENERLEYNKKITDTKPIIKRLTEINNLIAYLDIRELYIQYLACKAQLKKEHEKLEERRATCTNLTKLVDELEAKQKNVRVALSIINRNLSYIFSQTIDSKLIIVTIIMYCFLMGKLYSPLKYRREKET